MAHDIQLAQQGGRSFRLFTAPCDNGARGNGDGWPASAQGTELRRAERPARGVSRPPRTGLTAWFWRQVHDVLERTRDREQFWQRIQLELEKARRHDRQFVIARLRFDPGTGGTEQLGADLPKRLRYEDAVLVADGRSDEMLVLLAETDREAAGRVLDRLERQHATHRLREVAVVEFPADGFTHDGLVDALYATDASAVAAGVRPRIRTWPGRILRWAAVAAS